MRFRRSVRVPLHNLREQKPLRIVWDAVVATRGIGDGRLIPVVIVDTSERPDLEELVRVHGHLPPGDVEIQWGQLEGTDGTVALILSFKRPAEVVAILNFDIVTQGGLVDQILTARGLYFQPGREGDRLVNTLDAPKILVEVSETGFRDSWTSMFHHHIAKDMRKKGMSRQQAKAAASRFIEEWRRFGSLRMKRQ